MFQLCVNSCIEPIRLADFVASRELSVVSNERSIVYFYVIVMAFRSWQATLFLSKMNGTYIKLHKRRYEKLSKAGVAKNCLSVVYALHVSITNGSMF